MGRDATGEDADVFMSKAVGIENANHSKRFGKIFQALFELTFQEIGRAIPFAL